MFIEPMAPLGNLSGIKPIDTARAALQQEAGQQSIDIPFKEIFTTAVQNLKDTEIISNDNTALLALGDIDDLHTLGIDATKAYLAERLVIEIRNRAMDAYSELMRINM